MSSGEDLAANLRNYKIQLQQVEAALLNDPSNDELAKLKEDLETGIKLTKHLMSVEDIEDEDDEIIKGATNYNFKAGDLVMAPWSEDGQFYEAVIEDIMSDGQCNVMFNSLPSGKVKICEVCLVSLLKPISGVKKRPKAGNSGVSIHAQPQLNDCPSSSQTNAKKRPAPSREQVKKRQLKKLGRLKELEDEREKEKNKWQQFNHKAMSKQLKGASTLTKKQSIFKSPETVEGKVGVGTCGIAGKPMTEFVVADKYKRGTMSASSLAGMMDLGSKAGIPPGYK